MADEIGGLREQGSPKRLKTDLESQNADKVDGRDGVAAVKREPDAVADAKEEEANGDAGSVATGAGTELAFWVQLAGDAKAEGAADAKLGVGVTAGMAEVNLQTTAEPVAIDAVEPTGTEGKSTADGAEQGADVDGSAAMDDEDAAAADEQRDGIAAEDEEVPLSG